MSRLSWLMIFPSKIFLQLYDLVDTIFLVDGRWGLVHWPSFHSKEISAGACTSDNTFLKVIIDNRITVVLLKSKNYSRNMKTWIYKGKFLIPKGNIFKQFSKTITPFDHKNLPKFKTNQSILKIKKICWFETVDIYKSDDFWLFNNDFRKQSDF